jgi:heat shock protein HtpX
MRTLKSFGLLVLVNLLFVVVITAVLAVFHIRLSLAVFALFFGFGGAFLSLWMSKVLVKRLFHMTQVTGNIQGGNQPFYLAVQTMAQRAGIPMPELWIYEDQRPNAFTTGPSRAKAMIAVSTGLLGLLDQRELRAVIGHEMGHIYHGDMISTTLLMGLMNAFVIWLGNLAGRALGNNFISELLITIAFEMGLSFLALIPITAFSRHREYGADAFAAHLEGKDAMIAALRKLETRPVAINPRKEALATAYVHGPWGGLFATHPSVGRRIARLQSAAI